MSVGDLLPDRFGYLPNLVLRRTDADRDIDMNSATAGRLDVRCHPDAAENVADNERALTHDGERRPFHRIEIKMQVEGTIRVVAQRVPWIEIDATQVDQPQKRRTVVD